MSVVVYVLIVVALELFDLTFPAMLANPSERS
jgi:hypothetical protein